MPETNQNISLEFGALAPPLKEQLAGYRISESSLMHYQRDADAIARLSIRDLAGQTQTSGMRKKLFGRICKEVRERQKEGDK